MSNIVTNEASPIKTESEKPVQEVEEVKFPPFPDPTDADFEDDISEKEKDYYKEKFSDINDVKVYRLHCTACDRHLGCAARNENRMRSHPMLRTLMCNTCHTFYNSGEFEKGEDGSELYCRWCGQGGQVYCCSSCPHVFCAKCIKRNLGLPKIKEIENTDDWKCFKCEPDCLWDLRALCWALLRFCDLKNKLTYSTPDLKLREAYQKSCALDDSECCKHKINKRKSREDNKKVSTKGDVENSIKKVETSSSTVISKIPPTIQVKKFASINLDEPPKKAQKRSGIVVKNCTLPNIKTMPPAKCYSGPPVVKKMRMTNPAMNLTPIRFPQTPNASYSKIRPKFQQFPMPPMMMNNVMNNAMNNAMNGFNSSANFNNSYNSSGFNPMLPSDNINLSLEELTQGLDLAAVAAMAGNSNAAGNDVVCTPDFPLEPLVEMREAPDDDVQCLSGPQVSTHQPPPLVPRVGNELPDLAPENIVQMTENDVTVNPATGGLKFRVDPQTLSANKMYRLPDGRIFAINANPNMPGGYSATIVAVSENNKAPPKVPPRAATFSARLSAVTSTPAQPKPVKSKATTRPHILKSALKAAKAPNKGPSKPNVRECDLKVPIEWYRFNLVDAVDALEYSLSRLKKLKKEATTSFLRTRSVSEMRSLHKVLDRVLNTSSTRFQEIQENLDKGFKSYIAKKANSETEDISDDDDVEILNDPANDDPIYIDENSSTDSVADDTNPKKTQEIDLTDQGNSELNDSSEKSVNPSIAKLNDDQNSSEANVQQNAHSSNTQNSSGEDQSESSTAPDVNNADEPKDTADALQHETPKENNLNGDIDMLGENNDSQVDSSSTPEKDTGDKEDVMESENIDDNILEKDSEEKDSENENKIEEMNSMVEKNHDTDMRDHNTILTEDHNQETSMTDRDTDLTDDKNQDADMTEDMIENLLKDNLGDDIGANLSLLDIPELQET